MWFPHQASVAVLIGLMATGRAGIATPEYQRQTLQVPAVRSAWRGWQMSRLADVDNDGLVDLLAVGPVENRLWVYRQRAFVFPVDPDQTIELPAQTAWLALADVDAHPGLELLLSTATGLACLRQNHGVFESKPRALVHASQVFTSDTAPTLLSLNSQTSATNPLLPVICAAHAVLYQRDRADGWGPGPPLPLQEKQTHWSIERGGWLMASTHPRSLAISRSFLSAPAEEPEKEAEAEAVRRILVEKASPDRVNSMDLNGDGREDLVLWRPVGDLELKTDILVFLRSANNRLPEQPTQVLHCRGFPVGVGHPHQAGAASRRISPVCRLAGDARYELVLATLQTSITSASGVADLVLSGSMDWALTIRTFNQGFFSRSPDASISLTAMVPTEVAMPELFIIDGDFNGDGCPDVLVKRSPTQWDVVLSSARGWFAPKPAWSFEVPLEGNFVIQDLNADGLSDMVVQAWDRPTLFVFLSRPRGGKR